MAPRDASISGVATSPACDGDAKVPRCWKYETLTSLVSLESKGSLKGLPWVRRGQGLT